MGTRGLQGLGGRPQGRGCLLLAVAGATSLVTLLLAVPITVLAVLALVPQDQGRQVSGSRGLPPVNVYLLKAEPSGFSWLLSPLICLCPLSRQS